MTADPAVVAVGVAVVEIAVVVAEIAVAVVANAIAAKITDKLKISELFTRIRTQFLKEQHIRQFDPNLESFLNVNTHDDLQKARKRFEE